jgi:exopolysaccharide biosynthesis polyprenyl glycosylphosphotransferase
MAAWRSEGEAGRVSAATPRHSVAELAAKRAADRLAAPRQLLERRADPRDAVNGAGVIDGGGHRVTWTDLSVSSQSAEHRLPAGWAVRFNMIADVCLVCSIVIANGIQAAADGHGVAAHALSVALVALVWVITGSVLGYYDSSVRDREVVDEAALSSSMVLLTLLVMAPLFVPMHHSRSLILSSLLCWPMLILLRVGLFQAISRWEAPAEEVVIVGVGPLARATGEQLRRRARQRVVGYLFLPDDGCPIVLKPPLLGTWMDLENFLRTNQVGEVYIAADASADQGAVQHAIATCESLGVRFALPAYTFRLQRAKPVEANAVVDGYLHYAPVEVKRRQIALKRICDVLIASFALWLLAPLFIAVAVLIKATSRGPVFFKQLRCGLNGKRFHMLKFRSMVADAEQRRATLEALNESNGPVFKLRKDPRVTRIGAILRKYSIDELPQLINVLRGEMSIVGPRPPLPAEVVEYDSWQLRRLSVRPGLTCIWQVSANRHRISFDEWMYLDLQYVDHWNLLKDAEIILRTIPVVVSGSGEPPQRAAAQYNRGVSLR